MTNEIASSSAEFQATNTEEGLALIGRVANRVGGELGEWDIRANGWQYAMLKVGDAEMRVGVSAGGVVQVNGDPFTPVDRKMNVTETAVLASVEAARYAALDSIAREANGNYVSTLSLQAAEFEPFPVANAYLQQIIESDSPDLFSAWCLADARQLVEMFGTTPVNKTVFSLSDEPWISPENAYQFAKKATRLGKDRDLVMPLILDEIKDVPYKPLPAIPHHSEIYRSRIQPGMSRAELSEVSAHAYSEWQSERQGHTSFYLYKVQSPGSDITFISREFKEAARMEPIGQYGELVGRYVAGVMLPEELADERFIHQGVLPARSYVGEIVASPREDRITQCVGMNTYVTHNVNRLDRVPAIGEKSKIAYDSNGYGKVENRSLTRDAAHTR